MRRGWSVGYVGVALIVSLFAWARWFQRYDLGDELGPFKPTASVVAVHIALSILCCLAAAVRVLAGLTRWVQGARR